MAIGNASSPGVTGSDSMVTAVPGRRWQGWLANALLVLFLLSMVLSLVAIWMRAEVLDTDTFVRTVSPLARDGDIQLAVSEAVTAHLVQFVDETVQLDESSQVAGFLAVPLQASLEQYIQTVTYDVVTSPRFATLWEEASTVFHQAMENLLTGETREGVTSADGVVTLDLEPFVTEVTAALNARGIDLAQGQLAENRDLTLVLFESEDLANAQAAVRLLDDLAIYLPILAAMLLIGYLALSPRFWPALATAGFGVAIAMMLFLILLSTVRWQYLERLGVTINQDAAASVYDILLDDLRRAAQILGLLGLGIGLLVSVIWKRRKQRPQGESLNDALLRRLPIVGEAERWIQAHQRQLIGLTLAAVALVYLIFIPVDIASVVSLVVITVLVVALLLLVPEPSAEAMTVEPLAPLPTGTPGDTSIAELEALAALRSQNLLTDAEYALAKARILSPHTVPPA